MLDPTFKQDVYVTNDIWSPILLNNHIYVYSSSIIEDKGVVFYIHKNQRITPYATLEYRKSYIQTYIKKKAYENYVIIIHYGLHSKHYLVT